MVRIGHLGLVKKLLPATGEQRGRSGGQGSAYALMALLGGAVGLGEMVFGIVLLTQKI